MRDSALLRSTPQEDIWRFSCRLLPVLLYSPYYEQASAKADLSGKSNGFVAICAASLFILHGSAWGPTPCLRAQPGGSFPCGALGYVRGALVECLVTRPDVSHWTTVGYNQQTRMQIQAAGLQPWRSG